MYIIISVILLFFLFIFIPHTMKIKIECEHNKQFKIQNTKNYVIFNLFGILPIAKIMVAERVKKVIKNKTIIELIASTMQKINKAKNIKTKEILNIDYLLLNAFSNIKYKKLIISAGFNTNEYVINSYINAAINTLICMYINFHKEKFNFNKLYYQVYISQIPLKIYLDCIININFAKAIKEILKKYLKTNKLIKKRSEYYGRTSN